MGHGAKRHGEFDRRERVADQLRRELARIMQTGAGDPRLAAASLTAVQLSRDFSHAKVYYTALGKDDAAAAAELTRALNHAAGYIRARLAQGSAMRAVPRLRFHFDASVGRGRRLEALIAEAVAGSSAEIAPEASPEALT